MKTMFPILVVIALLAACAPTGPEGLPIAYQDNFDDTGSGWFADTFDAGEHSYQDGGYRIFISAVDWFSWVVNPSAAVYGDVQVEVDAHKLSGPDANEYGVVCRVDYDAGSLYAGVVTSDGQYAIYKSIDEGPLELVGMAAMGFSQSVNQGEATNHIRFDCIGNTLTLFANGTQLAQVSDDTLTSGEVGLYAGTSDPGNVEILFDNFVVYRP
jgi:hypothetical protein